MSVPRGDVRKTATPDRINNESAPRGVSAPTRSRVGFRAWRQDGYVVQR
jgi:hypothetical protein